MSISESDFIRSMSTAKPADIVAAAKKQGIKLTTSFVYAVRAMDKKRGRTPKGKPSSLACVLPDASPVPSVR